MILSSIPFFASSSRNKAPKKWILSQARERYFLFYPSDFDLQPAIPLIY